MSISPENVSTARDDPSPPLVALSMGDPAGIGPEIIVKALSSDALRSQALFIVFGSRQPLELAAVAAGIKPFWTNLSSRDLPAAMTTGPRPHLKASRVLVVDLPLDAGALPSTPGHSAEGGRSSFAAIEHAIALLKLPSDHTWHASALVTAPISKTSWDLARRAAPPDEQPAYGPTGRGFPGHTELLADRLNSPGCGMLFVGPSMRVMLATIHIPLMRVREHLTMDGLLTTITLAHRACIDLGVTAPRLGICGLNPHAGEDGLLGTDDAEVIAPAVAAARQRGINASGPHPADTIFHRALIHPEPSASVASPTVPSPTRFDCIVAMYHDQGLIPVKLTDPHATVNVTVGLRDGVVRTSPAHGTAFDIAGQNLADPRSMRAAVELALEMCTRRSARRTT